MREVLRHGLDIKSWKAKCWEAATRPPLGGVRFRGLDTLQSSNPPIDQPDSLPTTSAKATLSEQTAETHDKKRNPAQTITLQMFSAEASQAKNPVLRSYVRDSHFNWLSAVADPEKMAAHEELRKNRYLSNHPEVSEQTYETNRAEALDEKTEKVKNAVNKSAYRTVQKNFALQDTEEAHDFYERQRSNANSAIMQHNDLVAPGDISRTLKNEIELPKRPADLLEMYLEQTTDPVLRYEIKRQVLLAHISGEIERNSSGGREKLAQIQTLLDKNLYDGKTGSTNQREVFGTFDSTTNSVVQLLEEKPAEPAPEGTHYKLLQIPARKVKGMDNLVLTQINTKEREAAINKSLRKAIQRSSSDKNSNDPTRDEIRPDEDVRDTDRMKLVVFGGEAAANTLLDKVFDILSDRKNQKYLYDRDKNGNVLRDEEGNPKGVPIDVIPDDNTNGDEGQSNHVKFRRILMPFKGLENPIEIIVQPLENYINDQFEIGSAHELYKIKRELGITKVLFDKTVYSHITYPDENGTGSTHPTLIAKTQELLQRDVFPVKYKM